MLAYAMTVFLSAFLLFEVEPLIAKEILPWFGGASSVWTTCLLFFQIVLLGGYSYSHVLCSRFGPRGQKRVHLTLLAVSLVLILYSARVWNTPLMPGSDWKPDATTEPVWRILAILIAGVGVPYFLLSSTGPLIQSWFGHRFPERSPYRLYALSNLASLSALIGYPFFIEWFLPLQVQARTWSWMYAAFAVCCGYCALSVADHDVSNEDSAVTQPVRWTRRLLWLSLAACGSALLLATTNQLCLGVASVPFLWILPLAVYLLSFVLCFDSERWYRRSIFHPVFGAAAGLACYALYHPFDLSLPAQIAIYSTALFACCMVCHGELARLKPAPRRLTSFYVYIAAGGAIGGAFVSLLAPRIFPGYWEYHLSLWISALLAVIVAWLDTDSWCYRSRLWVPVGIIVVACFFPIFIAYSVNAGKQQPPDWKLIAMGIIAIVLVLRVAYRSSREAVVSSPTLVKGSAALYMIVLAGMLFLNARPNQLMAVRNFYGLLSVQESRMVRSNAPAYELRNGPIIHGYQFIDSSLRKLPTSYYGRQSAVGLALTNHPRRSNGRPEDRALNVGVVGLGIGTVAAYGASGDHFRFYEINPEVARLANSDYFSYLKDTPARVEVVIGDARLSLERELLNGHPQEFDVFVLDAFSGDAIPVHLLTREAFKIYLRHLRPSEGLIAVHISNRFLDLRPVLWKIAQEFSLRAAFFHAAPEEGVAGESEWVILAPNGALLDRPAFAKAAERQQFDGTSFPFWTDDYSNLFRILR